MIAIMPRSQLVEMTLSPAQAKQFVDWDHASRSAAYWKKEEAKLRKGVVADLVPDEQDTGAKTFCLKYISGDVQTGEHAPHVAHVTVTRKVNAKLPKGFKPDGQYKHVYRLVPESWVVDAKALKDAEEVSPGIRDVVEKDLTITPAAPTITVK